MSKGKVIELEGPASVSDGLTELLRTGARKLIKEAVEAEFAAFLASYQDHILEDGRAQVVRNGFLPEREIQTGIGSVEVRVPRARDRGGEGIKFTSALLPPYLRRAQSVAELLPWLYLKGVSTNDFQEALASLLGEGAAGLSPSTISRLKASWQDECQLWSNRSLASERYVYLWVDGIHCGVRQENEKVCILVMLGVREDGKKELIAIDDGYRESCESWLSLLRDVKERGMEPPKLAIGDGALGFWKALREVFPTAKEQRCWQHKSANVLDKLPNSLHEKAKNMLHEVRMADSESDAMKAFNRFKATFKDKHPKAVETLEKDISTMLTFYQFPAMHWQSIRTTNPIESAFATVRHRSTRTKGCVSRATLMALVYRLMLSAQLRWKKLRGFSRLAEVIHGVNFVDGLNQRDRDNLKLIEDGRIAA